MNSSNLKGALLEYLVRRLLSNCGFIGVKSDDLYLFEKSGLFFINGKGAAHDADVLMEPPLQMPFSYPSRILFECKAYDCKTPLTIVRNALGLRYDINEFEIVTLESLVKRKNNRRAAYAIEDRKRFNYSVGVASIKGFTKPAVEFAANNKIPIISLNWFLPENILSLFGSITQRYVDQLNPNLANSIYSHLKHKEKQPAYYVSDYVEDECLEAGHLEEELVESEHLDENLIEPDYLFEDWLEQDQVIGTIIRGFNNVLDQSFIGLIETGDIIFLYETESESGHKFRHTQFNGNFKAQIHYHHNDKNYWKLTVFDENSPNITYDFNFFIPQSIMEIWKKYNYDRAKAIDLKQEYFSRIFLYKKTQNLELPFYVINIDRHWLENIHNNNV